MSPSDHVPGEPAEATTPALEARLSVTLEAENLDATVRWYLEKLTATVATTMTDRSRDGTIATDVVGLRLGGVIIWLHQSRGPRSGQIHRGGMHLSLMTRAPLEEILSDLRARGVDISHHPMDGFDAEPSGLRRGADADFAYLIDPDGRLVEICRPRSTHETCGT